MDPFNGTNGELILNFPITRGDISRLSSRYIYSEGLKSVLNQRGGQD